MTIGTFCDDTSYPQESAHLWLPTEEGVRTGAGKRMVLSVHILPPASAT